MAMKKNLDDRARKKAFDEIFDKFDHNKNGKNVFFILELVSMSIKIVYSGSLQMPLFRNHVCQRFHQGGQEPSRYKYLYFVGKTFDTKA